MTMMRDGGGRRRLPQGVRRRVRAVAALAALALLTVPAGAHAYGQLTQLGIPTGACLTTDTSGGLCGIGYAMDLGRPQGAAITADGKSLYAAQAGSDGLSITYRDTTTGRLRIGGCIGDVFPCQFNPPGLVAPSAVATSADNKNVYVVSPSAGAIVSFSRTANYAFAGDLTPAGCLSSNGVPGCQPASALNGASDIAVSPDGKSVYVASSGGGLAVFKRNTTTGALTQTGCFGVYAPGCSSARGLDAATGVTVSPDNKSVYVAGFLGGTGSIVVFSRNVSTLKLTQPIGTAGCVSTDGSFGCANGGTPVRYVHRLTVTADNKSVYLSSGTTGPSGEGYVLSYRRNPNTSALTPIGCASATETSGCSYVDGIRGAFGISRSKDNKSVYVSTLATGGALVQFNRNTNTGALTRIDCLAGDLAVSPGCRTAVALSASYGVVVSADSKSAYATASQTDAIVAFKRTTGTIGLGRLTQFDRPPPGCTSDDGTDGTTTVPLCTDGTALRDAIKLVVTKDNKSVYVTGRGSDAVAVFNRNTTTGVLTQAGCVSETGAGPCTDGSALDEPFPIAASPDNKSVYVGSDGRDAITLLKRNATTGALTPAGCIAEIGGLTCTDGSGLEDPSAIAVSADNKSVYAVSASSYALVHFARNTTTGTLTQKGCFADGGPPACTAVDPLVLPYGVAVSPDGKSVYATSSSGSSSILVFARNTTTGALTPKGCLVELGSPDCAPARGISGALAVVVSADNQSVYVTGFSGASLGIFKRNTTTGALTQPAGTAGCMSAYGGEGCEQAWGLVTNPGAVAVSADNRSVYVAGNDGITVFDRVTAAGATHGNLSQTHSNSSCLGNGGPWVCDRAVALFGTFGIAVAPDNKNVYATGSSSGAVLSFARQTTP